MTRVVAGARPGTVGAAYVEALRDPVTILAYAINYWHMPVNFLLLFGEKWHAADANIGAARRF
jgi:hypothetical protein